VTTKQGHLHDSFDNLLMTYGASPIVLVIVNINKVNDCDTVGYITIAITIMTAITISTPVAIAVSSPKPLSNHVHDSYLSHCPQLYGIR
jgi:hypothetical protein